MDMKIIHKHKINIDGTPTEVDLPTDSQYRSTEYLVSKKSLYLWVEVPADLNAPKEKRTFRVFKTGDGIPDADQYIGTAIDQHQPEAYHLYEVQTDDANL